MNKKMNEARKRMLINALVAMAMLLIAGGLFLFRLNQLNPDQRLFDNPTFWLTLSIVVLSLIAFILVLRRNFKIDQNVAKLNEEYDLVFEQFSQYIAANGLSYFEKKELTHEILSLFLEAQEAGKEVDQLIGPDHQQFIDGMIRAYGVKSSWVVDLLTGLQYFIFYMILGQLFYYAKIAQQEAVSYFAAPMDYTTILFFGLSAFGLIPFINQQKRRFLIVDKKGQGEGSLNVWTIFLSMVLMVGIFIGTIEVLTRFFADLKWVAAFLHNGVVLISSAPILILWILGGVGLHFVKKYLRKAGAEEVK